MAYAHYAVPHLSSSFQPIFDAAVGGYRKQTKNDLLQHPLAAKFDACDSPDSVLAVLQRQVQGVDQSQSGDSDDELTRWLYPTVKVIFALSASLREGVDLVTSPATVIFTGIGVLILASRDVRSSQDTLIVLFKRIESFFRPLEFFTEVPMNPAMMDIFVGITAEIISVLAIATRDIKQGRAKKYLKQLAGRTDMENALNRLENLTRYEARTANAQLAREVRDTAVTEDGSVVSIDDPVPIVDTKSKRVHSRVAGVDDMELGINEMNRQHRLQRVGRWLSPPDPSQNHIAACKARHPGTGEWLLQTRLFQDWWFTGPLLWIHGKPGAGKSILCSKIIEYIEAMCTAGNAFMGYFYFDSRDRRKRNRLNMIPSLLMQLSTRSNLCCDMLFRFYSTHNKGADIPSSAILAVWLKEMVSIPGYVPIYLVLDGLDECPDSPGVPSPREEVLILIKELVQLRRPNLHLCVVSRLEADIQTVLEPLATSQVSLDDAIGHKRDIITYINSFVHSDRRIQGLRADDKQLIIDKLRESADGMFRFVSCQLEALRICLPQDVHRILDEFPRSLDETYERILREINNSNRKRAHLLFQCLTAAIQPLRVEELAVILAVDFDDPSGIPNLKLKDRRLGNQEQAILSACSSLITVVDVGDSRVVQFSHPSIKAFMSSSRLAVSSGLVSHYHVVLERANTILSQACLSVLLPSSDDDNLDLAGIKDIPLAEYAAKYWVEHARFKNVASHIHDMMEILFDREKSYFANWVSMYDMDVPLLPPVTNPMQPYAGSLYDASPGYPMLGASYMGPPIPPVPSYQVPPIPPVPSYQLPPIPPTPSYQVPMIPPVPSYQVPTIPPVPSYQVPPIPSALSHHVPSRPPVTSRHVSPVPLVSSHQVSPIPASTYQASPSYSIPFNAGYTTPFNVSSSYAPPGNSMPLNTGYTTPFNAGSSYYTPLSYQTPPVSGLSNLTYYATPSYPRAPNAAPWYPAEPTHTTPPRASPLYYATLCDLPGLARSLIVKHPEHVDDRGGCYTTAIHAALYKGHLSIAQLLIEYGADVTSRDDEDSTPLHIAAQRGHSELVQLLLSFGADVNATKSGHSPPLAMASNSGNVDVIRLLIDGGADVNMKDDRNSTPLHVASGNGDSNVVQALLDHKADVHSRDDHNSTPLHLASAMGKSTVVELLLEHNAQVNALDNTSSTALHFGLMNEHFDIVEMLIQHGADVKVPDNQMLTPLHLAAARGNLNAVNLLLQNGALVNTQDNNRSTPMHLASDNGSLEIVKLLIDHGADATALDNNNSTPLHLASDNGSVELVTLLIQHHANVNARDTKNSTPLHIASSRGPPDIVDVLLDNGGDPNARDDMGWTPLHIASQQGAIDVAKRLLARGANVNAEDGDSKTPLHLASKDKKMGHLLIREGADVHARDNNDTMPFQVRPAGHGASRRHSRGPQPHATQ